MQIVLQNSWPVHGSSRTLPLSSLCCFCCTRAPQRQLRKHNLSKLQQAPEEVNLKSLTSRVVELTRRRQLGQIFEEIEAAKEQHVKLNTIVMNAVMQACVHCCDIESALVVFDNMLQPGGCGVDDVTYGTLLKGLGDARRVDEAFELLESIEQGTAAGNPQLSAVLLCGLLNALIESGDLRRANGLLARYGHVLQENGGQSILIFNLMMKGYISAGCPRSALNLLDEILKHGLNPDRLTYNTLIFACVKTGNLDTAMVFFKQMKDKAHKNHHPDVSPDIVTYTTLIQGFGRVKDIYSVEKILTEMKLCEKIQIDRVAYTTIVDSLINCGSTEGALCVFGEIIKQAKGKPKPHLFMSMMRAFAAKGDHNMVRRFLDRMWLDSTGTISPLVQTECDHLLMEAALNEGQVDLALEKLKNVAWKWRNISWSTRAGMVALRLEALMGLNKSVLGPRVLPQVSLSDSIDCSMILFDEAKPLEATLRLEQVVMRLFKDSIVPIIDECGECIGILHREDCHTLDAPLAKLMRSPPPFVSSSTSIGCVINLMLEKGYKMVIIVKCGEFAHNISSLRAVGIFTYENLCKLANTPSIMDGNHL